MLELLKLKGKLKGSYDGMEFALEFKNEKLRIDIEDKQLIKIGKDLFLEDLKKQKGNPTAQNLLDEVDVEIYLERELIARLGKSAKPSFVSSFIGVKNLEIVSNSRMSELMELL